VKHYLWKMVLVVCLVWAGTLVPAAAAEGDNLPVESWVGHSFVFQPQPQALQSAGYEIFKLEQAQAGFDGDRSVRLPYANYVGHQVTVTETIGFSAGNEQRDYMVYMTVQDTGEKLVGRTRRGQLAGLVLAADLENARHHFVGMIIYPKVRALTKFYVPGETKIMEAVPIRIASPVTVTDVYIGEQVETPIWLVVTAGEQKAILPIAYSWTNMPPNFWQSTDPWQDELFQQDPRVELGDDPVVWNKIQNGIVEPGMTKAQVKLSWGSPVRGTDADDIWLYGTYKLTFAKGLLSVMEKVAETPATYKFRTAGPK